ncbi:hypothetical protein CRI77_20030 [Mycolicibacterium duvalii]|uniref:Uncharacterized protein n=1 Tax=Mycolicibacterium duvalii TaxID=39688 RepID=A0A7I7JW32_9MYCO|nr:hypothetical protein [Mycolicibacterium duvalii]MCV7369267.1 hypothetical protein [Mycolicibacterium duvalii]PEG37673.1 hypothetical protein CRI77_20030 [Mycolicibacterium duvalii]BBX15451.1 hypothetical protein MDUV_03110 [Mycolicibacterium duvalii]
MQVKKMLAAAAIAGGLGAAGTAFGTGTAGADPKWWDPVPPPGHIGQVVNVPPGHIGQWVGVPPGHWDKPWKWLK